MKETILAIILGSLLGFGLTGGYFALKRSRPNQNTNVTPTPTEVLSNSEADSLTKNITPEQIEDTPPNTNSESNLTIDSPENETIVNNSQVTIKGSTTPQASIVITTASNSYHTTASSTGSFSQVIEADSGINQIQIDAINLDDSQTTKKIFITYSTAKI
ncbi:hypothetical protein KBC75_05605 [Candidatus Shapirobacteria bacterium]|nr:hypothetical protein [Candidatus Shapirobacteria bacterium]